MDDLIADFLTETQEGLAALDVALVRLEKAPDDAQTVSEIFRVIHTIKGTCGFLGLPRLEKVAHAGETMLGRYRDGTLKVTPDGITLILGALDRIKAIIAGIERMGAEPAGDDAALIAALDAVADGSGDAAPATAPPVEQAAEQAADQPVAEAAGLVTPQSIRVSVEVLEDLMTLVSELVLTRNQLMQVARGRGDQAFAVPLQRLSHITSDLQDGVMKTRMQPIGNAWAKLPRLVRDVAREVSKKIELEMRGEGTELDRQVLELIKDPLTHMVRNSADHGLERPEERRRAGKPEVGRIMLDAYHEGGHILIRIADDGQGLNTARIREKAVAQGLATEAEAAAMPDAEIHRFIFRAGFSTAAAVTAVSGRGVGMDVVKTNVERIGGTIDVASAAGRGTSFTIKIPLTLAIVSALVVRAGGERFAIPQLGVLEMVRVGGTSGARVERIKDAPVLRLRDRLLPLVSLAHMLGLGDTASDAGADSGFVVVTQLGASTFGLIVDELHDTEEIVVKPVPPILRHIGVFSGNTILGDGSVIMILDPNGIARATGVTTAGAATGEAEGAGGGMRSSAKTAMLLFRAGDATPKAVPLGLVARLDDLPVERIEYSGGIAVVQYRDQLMPLLGIGEDRPGQDATARGRQTVLVFSEGGRSLGLMVDAILDVVEERLEIQGGQDRPGFLGSAVVAGRVTDVLDTAWWLRQSGHGWLGMAAPAPSARLLVVEDSAFYRELVVPTLAAAGYDVVAVADPAEALRLRDRGAVFDAIVSDLEMPGMDGFAFARAVREGGPWAGLPLVALSGRADASALGSARDAGFTDFVTKYDRASLVQSLRACLGVPVAA
jgi:two-component system chemotaxis sensor kinase CheA